MKKSQLRKIIRESIKGLMNEQASNARSHNVHTCVGNNGATGLIRNLTVDNQIPVVGQYFNCADLGANGGILSNKPNNVAAGNFCQVGMEKPQYLVGGQTNVTLLGTGGCATANSTTSSGTCNPSAWSNHANWTSTFTNTVNNLIANPNPNQPCNFLTQKKNQFTSMLGGGGANNGNAANQWQCKLDLITQLHSSNNC
jgi:hypothetical protein